MKNKHLLILITLLSLSLISSNAFAQRRHGIFAHAGLMLGAGGGTTTLSGNNYSTSSSDSWAFNGGLDLGTGLPLTKMFVLTLNGYWYGQHRKISDIASSFTNDINILAGTDIFFFGNFVVGAQLGFAYLMTTSKSTVGNTTHSASTDNPGWAFRFSAGYEIPIKRYTLGIRGYYMHTFTYPAQNITATYAGAGVSIYIRYY